MNGWLGQAPVRSVRGPALGWQSPTAVGMYRPPPLKMPMAPVVARAVPQPVQLSAAELGDDSSPWSPSLGTSFLLLAGGGAALYFSVALPSPADSIAKGLGIAAAAWGGYNLVTKLFGPSVPQVDNKAKAEAPPTATMSPEAFAKVSGQIIFPLPDTSPKIQSDWLAPEYFEIKVVWRNDSDEIANFKYNILAEACCAPGLYVQGQTSTLKIIDDSQVTGLQPHTESGAIPLKVELFQPPAKAGANPTYKIYLTLQKIGPSGPVPAGDSVIFGPFEK